MKTLLGGLRRVAAVPSAAGRGGSAMSVEPPLLRVEGHSRRFPAARRVAAALTVALPLLHAPEQTNAQEGGRPVFGEKVYFPGTKNYYELVGAEAGDSHRGALVMEITWERAMRKATRRSYKGVQGRLAVVRSEKLHTFLKRTFRPDQITWIGLRYWCRFNRMQWVNGDFHDRSDYQRWDTVWARLGGRPHGQSKPRCHGAAWYWPVHYWGVGYGFRWNANDMQKEGHAYFVEYPTGKP